MPHTHYLISTGPISGLDVVASILSFNSAGRFPLAGDFAQPEREELAALLGDGLLADLLRGPAPILVDSIPDAYLIREV